MVATPNCWTERLLSFGIDGVLKGRSYCLDYLILKGGFLFVGAFSEIHGNAFVSFAELRVMVLFDGTSGRRWRDVGSFRSSFFDVGLVVGECE